MIRCRTLVLTAWVVALLAAAPSWAQDTVCATSNCTFGTTAGNPNLPAACQNIATPRIIEIGMTASPSLRFVPSSIRIEGETTTPGVPWSYQCIQWHNLSSAVVPWHSATEDSLASSCNLAQACTLANITPPCDWETGNITAAREFGVCHYAAVAPASYSFQCRLHELFGMRGTFTVVQPIDQRVELNILGEPELTWNAGGVGPWNVWRDTTGAMPGPTNLTVGGTSSRTLTDTTAGDIAYYLVLELTTGCGNGVREGTELCDGADLGGASCLTQGFDGGPLSCTGTCDGFDTSACTLCGNTVCEPAGGEDCLSCTDCNGVQGGNPGNRFCCGDGAGDTPVDCSDPRCTGNGNTCVE